MTVDGRPQAIIGQFQHDSKHFIDKYYFGQIILNSKTFAKLKMSTTAEESSFSWTIVSLQPIPNGAELNLTGSGGDSGEQSSSSYEIASIIRRDPVTKKFVVKNLP